MKPRVFAVRLASVVSWRCRNGRVLGDRQRSGVSLSTVGSFNGSQVRVNMISE